MLALLERLVLALLERLVLALGVARARLVLALLVGLGLGVWLGGARRPARWLLLAGRLLRAGLLRRGLVHRLDLRSRGGRAPCREA